LNLLKVETGTITLLAFDSVIVGSFSLSVVAAGFQTVAPGHMRQ
jgi:hypothetical protein